MSRWGEPTQTFVRREAEAVAALGVDVSVLSIKRPTACLSAIPVTHLGFAQVAAGFVRACLRRPRAVAGVMGAVVRKASARNVAPLLGAAVVGIAWAGSGPPSSLHLHAHFGWVSAASAWACASVARRRFSVVLHAFELHTATHVDGFTPVPLLAADRVFAISSADAEAVRDRWSVRAEVLRMGVPESWLVDERRSDVDPWLVVSVGSLNPKKGHEVLIRALALADPRWRLVIVGEGSQRDLLADLVVTLGLSARVDLLGGRPEGSVRDLLDHAAVFALACQVAPDGDHDGIPVALMEAMARRVPVVTTAVSAIPELVDGAGLLVPPGGVRALADALDSLVDPSRRDQLGGTGLARVADEFVVERSAGRVAALAGPGRDELVDEGDGAGG